MELLRNWIPSPFYSASRTKNDLLVIHSAEGANSFQSLGEYFRNPSFRISAHVGIDNNIRGQIGEYVKPDNKAWTAFKGNDWGEHAQLCGLAAWTREQWLEQEDMLANLVDWLKEEAARYSIPLVKLTGQDVLDGKRGVCGHVDLADAGSGGAHTDPGPNFPWDIVMQQVGA